MKFKYLFLILTLNLISCSTSDEPISQPTSNTNNPDDTGGDNSGDDGSNNSGNMGVSYLGDFVNAVHETSGIAKVNSENTTLILENFSTENGPVLELYLATDLNVDTYISLGGLQGLMGDFEYTLPNGNIDFNQYKYVIVWCVDFSVNFGYAELEAL